MVWNQPSGPNNQWGRRPGQGSPDLDERLKSWQRKLESLLRPGARGGEGGSLLLLAALLAVVVWLYSGVYTVKPAEQGVVQRFGALVLPVSQPGIHWRIPWPVETVNIVDVGSVNSSDFKSRVLTSDVNLVDLHFAVQYRFSDPVKKPGAYMPTTCRALTGTGYSALTMQSAGSLILIGARLPALLGRSGLSTLRTAKVL